MLERVLLPEVPGGLTTAANFALHYRRHRSSGCSAEKLCTRDH